MADGSRNRRLEGVRRWTLIFGCSAIARGSGVPSYPTKSTSAPLAASARAWYCIRALRPRSASARTTARMLGMNRERQINYKGEFKDLRICGFEDLRSFHSLVSEFANPQILKSLDP